MFKRISILGTLVFALALIAAPEPVNARHYDDECRNCGTVRSVQQIRSRDRHYGGGAVLGALIGGAVGNRVGDRHGDGDHRRAATVGGAVVGGVVGHNVERRNRGYSVAYRISVRSDRGRIVTYDQPRSFGLRPGDRVELYRDGVEPYYRR